MSVVEREAVREVAPPTVADVLNRAADLLEEFGWCQNEMGDKSIGKMCAGGAIGEAWCDLYGEYPDIYWSVLTPDGSGNTINVARIMGVESLPTWNDDPARTRDEVVARLRARAVELS